MNVWIAESKKLLVPAIEFARTKMGAILWLHYYNYYYYYHH